MRYDPSGWKSRQQDLDAVDHITSTVRKQRERDECCYCLAPFIHAYLQDPTQGMILSTLVGRPTSIYLVKIILHRHAQRSTDSQMILDPVQWRVSSDHVVIIYYYGTEFLGRQNIYSPQIRINNKPKCR